MTVYFKEIDMHRKTWLEPLQHRVGLVRQFRAYSLQYDAGMLTKLAMVGRSQSQGPGVRHTWAQGLALSLTLCVIWTNPFTLSSLSFLTCEIGLTASPY